MKENRVKSQTNVAAVEPIMKKTENKTNLIKSNEKQDILPTNVKSSQSLSNLKNDAPPTGLQKHNKTSLSSLPASIEAEKKHNGFSVNSPAYVPKPYAGKLTQNSPPHALQPSPDFPSPKTSTPISNGRLPKQPPPTAPRLRVNRDRELITSTNKPSTSESTTSKLPSDSVEPHGRDPPSPASSGASQTSNHSNGHGSQTSSQTSSSGYVSESKLEKDVTLTNALDVLKQAPMTSSLNSNRNRFAPRTVIANAYMNKLTASTAANYKQNTERLYSDFYTMLKDKKPESSTENEEINVSAHLSEEPAVNSNKSDNDTSPNEQIDGNYKATRRRLSSGTASPVECEEPNEGEPDMMVSNTNVRRRRRGNLKSIKGFGTKSRRVSFDPLALLLDASLEGELELVMRSAKEVPDVSAPNDEGITALHNAICAGHLEIVEFLVRFGANVNAPDSDGWTPLHCAASCNNLPIVKFLVQNGACIFATTVSDQETAADKCEQEEDNFDGCSKYLYGWYCIS